MSKGPQCGVKENKDGVLVPTCVGGMLASYNLYKSFNQLRENAMRDAFLKNRRYKDIGDVTFKLQRYAPSSFFFFKCIFFSSVMYNKY